MIIRFIILLSFAATALFSQTPSVKEMASRYEKYIHKKLIQGKLRSKRYPERSLYGGALNGYYLNTKLVLITASNNVAYCSNEYSYYLKNDSLILVTEHITKIQEPENFEEYITKHTDKNNNTDLSKLPLETDNNNRYYFHGDTLVDCHLKSFQKEVKATEDFMAKKNKTVLMFYRSHLEELKAAVDSH